ncbi:DUF6193 family natural product biosynthesis protein [Kitasatospora sp. NBC_00070]|uniref:DUF6193 family natural product biosynthesis protein n=1 Tax=Kitasatospora sp. NBC_00070 TaxID=2975962 RepID=UPI003246CA53
MNLGAGHGETDWDDDGALQAALRRTADELGLALPEPDEGWGRLAKYVDAGIARRTTVYPPKERRAFQVNLQAKSTRLACGWTADLAEVVRATATWMSGAGLEQTRAHSPFIRFRPWALAHEQEPLGAVELEWCGKLDRVHMPPYDRHPRAHALLVAAHAQPALRQLMPVNSHFNLWFSTTVEGWMKTRVGYLICPYDEGRYGVRRDGVLVARTETPEEAVALVVAALPPDLGPAR